MIRWLAAGLAVAVAAAAIWSVGAAHAPWPAARLPLAAIGAFGLAWWAPLWWTVDSLLAVTAKMLRYVQSSVGAVEAEAIYAEVVSTGRSWVEVASKAALKHYDAPPWAGAVAPTVWEVASPLFAMPIDDGVAAVKQRTNAVAGRWRRRMAVARAVWAAVAIGPPLGVAVYWWTTG